MGVLDPKLAIAPDCLLHSLRRSRRPRRGWDLEHDALPSADLPLPEKPLHELLDSADQPPGAGQQTGRAGGEELVGPVEPQEDIALVQHRIRRLVHPAGLRWTVAHSAHFRSAVKVTVIDVV